MIMPNRKPVIRHIQEAAERQDFHVKVETDDPEFDTATHNKELERFVKEQDTFGFRAKSFAANHMADFISGQMQRNLKIVGMEHFQNLQGGAIVTSNHFSPMDTTIIRRFVQSTGEKRRLYIVSQETNLAMQGILGFFMNYTNIIPISRDHKYMSKYFEPMVSHVLQEGNVLLIYPEQEMWFHYRKPRPGKRGAYYYAALYGVPVVSCFVEMQELKSWDKKPFHKLQFILHVLPVIYPDPARTVQENSREMAVLDYQQRMLAYEQAYGKKLVYDFTPWDIAGWEQTETGIF